MKLTKISASDYRTIKSEVERALQTIGLKYGLSIDFQRAVYNSNVVEVKAQFKTDAGDKNVISSMNSSLSVFGLKVGDRIRSSKNGILTVVGYNSRAHLYPIKLQTLDGKRLGGNVHFCQTNLIK